MRRSVNILIAGIALGVIACGGGRTGELQPVPSVRVVVNGEHAAVMAEAGVRVEARVAEWRWDPRTLARTTTPILVLLTNESSRPLRIRYNKFHLSSEGGRTFAALPPYDVGVRVGPALAVRAPAYPMEGFAVAPYLAGFYPETEACDGSFGYDPIYYDPYVTRFRQLEAPSTEMIRRALPEGVLAPGGRVGGFLYFEAVGGEGRRIAFEAELVDALTNQPFGAVTIPFDGGS